MSKNTEVEDKTMILSEKVQQAFEEWYMHLERYKEPETPMLGYFVTFPWMFQSGVYREFFRSRGVEVEVTLEERYENHYKIHVFALKSYAEWYINYGYTDHIQAEQAAFTEAGRILEKQLP